MTAQKPHLDGLDPRALLLPHGTEVSTRVDRFVGERRIPQGAVGRVVAIQDDEYDVQIVGGAVARYRRSELLPRKAGQMRYARRRDATWEALGGCVVLEAVVGSHAWGLSGPDSDVDRRGVFVLPFPWTNGLTAPPVDLVSAGGSTTCWEIGKAIRQGLRADPNTLELLFVDSVRAIDPVGEWMLAARDAFVSVELYGTFGRYAISQLKKLEQSLRLARHRGLVLDWLRAEALPLDALAERLAREAEIAAPTPSDAHHLARQYIKQLYGSLYDQGLLPAREFAALVSFARNEQAAFELPRELRPKNAYNLLRLIVAAIRWLREGTPSLRLSEDDPLRARLLSIKRGDVPLDEVLREAEALMPALEEARRVTRLPPHGDVTRADTLLRRVREEMARRWAERRPGPFGADAAPAPEASWEDDDDDPE